jgi:hypothetical protein
VRRSSLARVHAPGLLARLRDRLRGRKQRLIRAGEQMPLLLVSYPPEAEAAAWDLEAAYARSLPAMCEAARGLYVTLWPALPAIVVVLLRSRNPCGCLGHHHPPGTESRLARRLASELGHPVAEIDLAYDSIRSWCPEPLSSLAAGDMTGELEPLRFRVALLAVLLHEMEHLAFPERGEPEIRHRSREFYRQAMAELVARELGRDYGIA